MPRHSLVVELARRLQRDVSQACSGGCVSWINPTTDDSPEERRPQNQEEDRGDDHVVDRVVALHPPRSGRLLHRFFTAPALLVFAGKMGLNGRDNFQGEMPIGCGSASRADR